MSSYTYGSTVKERVFFMPPSRKPAEYQITKMKIVICATCKTGTRIIEGCACITCKMLGIKS